MWALVIVIAIIVSVIVAIRKRDKKISSFKLPANAERLLIEHVPFYSALDPKNKIIFTDRVRDFLANTAVTGVGVTVTDLDRILIGASAIIPIFAFTDWRYNNISEVLLYEGTFNKQYEVAGADASVIGMVGDGAMHRQMILSQPALRAGFSNPADGHNTAIHEFVHLLDKADGSVDGIPEYLLSQPSIIPWVRYMRETIQQMRADGRSDINLYGATNEAEFFAVVSEYFFERPAELKENHPELYALLEEMFIPKKEKSSLAAA